MSNAPHISPFAHRRAELADFLRVCRARLDPRAAGLTPGPRRRTPGLRREELAQLAGLSVDWYTRLEQARDVHPSRETLAAIARVLRLSDDERGHLFYLGTEETTPRAPARQERAEPSMLAALAATTAPAAVMSPRFDVLAWNEPLTRLCIDFRALPVRERNFLWLTFKSEAMRARYADIALIERETVASFRHSAAAYVGHPDFEALIASLHESSPAFRALWAKHDVRVKTAGSKVFCTDEGPVTLDWHLLASPSASKQSFVFYVARDGDASPNGVRLARHLARGAGR